MASIRGTIRMPRGLRGRRRKGLDRRLILAGDVGIGVDFLIADFLGTGFSHSLRNYRVALPFFPTSPTRAGGRGFFDPVAAANPQEYTVPAGLFSPGVVPDPRICCPAAFSRGSRDKAQTGASASLPSSQAPWMSGSRLARRQTRACARLALSLLPLEKAAGQQIRHCDRAGAEEAGRNRVFLGFAAATGSKNPRPPPRG